MISPVGSDMESVGGSPLGTSWSIISAFFFLGSSLIAALTWMFGGVFLYPFGALDPRGFVGVIFIVLRLLGCVTGVVTAVLILLKARPRWPLLFAVVTIVASGPWCYRLTLMTITSIFGLFMLFAAGEELFYSWREGHGKNDDDEDEKCDWLV